MPGAGGSTRTNGSGNSKWLKRNKRALLGKLKMFYGFTVGLVTWGIYWYLSKPINEWIHFTVCKLCLNKVGLKNTKLVKSVLHYKSCDISDIGSGSFCITLEAADEILSLEVNLINLFFIRFCNINILLFTYKTFKRRSRAPKKAVILCNILTVLRR